MWGYNLVDLVRAWMIMNMLPVDTLVMPLSAKHTQETPLQAQVGRSWF